jgi:hypothetical protein
MIIIINTPPDKYYPLPHPTQVCVYVVWSICHMLFFADAISARRFSFPGLLWRSLNEPPSIHTRLKVFLEKLPALHGWLLPSSCVLIFLYTFATILYFPFWVRRFPPLLFVQMGFQLSKELFFLKIIKRLFSVPHITKENKNECTINPTAKP